MLNSSLTVLQENKDAECGFTLIELMVTIAVMAIIASIAVPNMSRLLANQSVKATASIVEDSLKSAIAESSIRGQSLIYTLDTSAKNITITAPNSADPSKPISIMSYNYSDTVTVVLGSGQPSSFRIGPGKRIRNNADTDTLSVTFSVCDNRFSGESQQKVSINTIAQVRRYSDGVCT